MFLEGMMDTIIIIIIIIIISIIIIITINEAISSWIRETRVHDFVK
jgi:hypothetical protein